MPNPAILNALANPARMELADPMDQYGKMLQMRNYLEQGDAAREKRESVNKMNKLYSDAAGLDPMEQRKSVRLGAAKNNLGHLIPEMDKKWGEIDEIGAKTKQHERDARKTFADTIGKVLENNQKMMMGVDARNPQVGLEQFATQVKLQELDPDFIELFKQRGVDPKVISKLAIDDAIQHAKTGQWASFVMKHQGLAKEAIQKHYNLIQTDKSQKIVASGPDGFEVAGTFDPAPKAAGTTVNITNEAMKVPSEYSKKRAELSAIRDEKIQEIAESAQDQIEDVERVQGLLGQAMTGTGAGAMESLASAAAQLGSPIVSKDVLSATQEVRMALAQIALVNIGTLREQKDVKLGSVTEKEFAQLQASAPKMTDQPAVINAWLERYKQTLRRMQQRFNTRNQQLMDNPSSRPFQQTLPRENVPVAPAPKAAPTKPDGNGLADELGF